MNNLILLTMTGDTSTIAGAEMTNSTLGTPFMAVVKKVTHCDDGTKVQAGCFSRLFKSLSAAKTNVSIWLSEKGNQAMRTWYEIKESICCRRASVNISDPDQGSASAARSSTDKAPTSKTSAVPTPKKQSDFLTQILTPWQTARANLMRAEILTPQVLTNGPEPKSLKGLYQTCDFAAIKAKTELTDYRRELNARWGALMSSTSQMPSEMESSDLKRHTAALNEINRLEQEIGHVSVALRQLKQSQQERHRQQLFGAGQYK